MVSQKQYNTLKNASDSYLSHEDFGIRDIENVMSEIFGSECTEDEAVSWTCQEEIYGAVFDEGDDDESSPITFIRGVNLERLAIEAFVDLANPKLELIT